MLVTLARALIVAALSVLPIAHEANVGAITRLGTDRATVVLVLVFVWAVSRICRAELPELRAVEGGPAPAPQRGAQPDHPCEVPAPCPETVSPAAAAP